MEDSSEALAPVVNVQTNGEVKQNPTEELVTFANEETNGKGTGVGTPESKKPQADDIANPKEAVAAKEKETVGTEAADGQN